MAGRGRSATVARPEARTRVYEGVDYDDDVFDGGKRDDDGFILGAGGELALTDSAFGKVEYRYSNYNEGDFDVNGANANLDPLFEGIGVVRHSFVVGAGLRF